ncbi:hypothetical protein [Photobacterium sp. OFAV2-7]|uniref:hypothetical protein n=1 Tax=Photobacterium sp. OFAV2-7 TaxID=2917748 RepID=UPI001EF672CB|nr:hypothetical protein [Photobacterium sp. OFAV2-7]MCG7587239.1 hypothetical protein [Photobacterium sp. OFAV2-7]
MSVLLRASDTEQQLVVKHCLCLHQVIHPTQIAAALAELGLTKAELPDSEGSESVNAGLNNSQWWTEELSAPQQAWLNQGLLEHFGLIPLLSELAPLQYWALLPWQVLEEVLTLWSAWFHLDAITRIICRNDLQVIRDNLGNDYDWLMAHGRLHPANPHPTELSSHSHSSFSWLSNLARRSRSKSARDLGSSTAPNSITALNWQQEKARTRNLIVGKLTQDWPESWRWLLQLKLPVCSEKESIPPSAFSSLSINMATLKVLSLSLMVCLQRKSPEWYEWLKRFQS